MKSSKILLITIIMILTVSMVQAITLDFETDDDFVTPLENGRQVESMFGNVVNISSTVIGPGSGHLGATIFDSSSSGPNKDGADKDLLVDLGNILILQNSDYSTQTIPGIFDVPNDEHLFENRGAIIFDFISPLEMLSIDLIDINGGALAKVTLTDNMGRQRQYSAGPKWTTDVSIEGVGWHTLDLTTLLDQPCEPGAIGDDAYVEFNDPDYDGTKVMQLKVDFIGQSPSGAMDNITFIPEPCTMIMLGLGSLFLRRKKR